MILTQPVVKPVQPKQLVSVSGSAWALRCLLMLMAATGGVQAQDGSSGPVLHNESFEEPAGESFDAERAPRHWHSAVMAVHADGNAQSVLTHDNSVAHAGASSLKLQGDAQTVRWLAALQSGLGVRAGQRYLLRGWMRTAQVQRTGSQYLNCNLFVQFQTAEGSVIPSEGGAPVVATHPLVGTHGWTKVERLVRAPAGAAHATVGCFLTCSGSAWFDDVSLVPLAQAEWKEADRGRYIYHWEHDGTPPDLVVKTNEAFLTELERHLETQLSQPVQYYYYPDNARKAAITGVAGNAHVEGSDEIHSIFWTDRHEVVHLLTRTWGSGSALLAEGLAVHLSGSWHAEPVDVPARRMLADGSLLPLEQIVATTGFRGQDDLITYPQSGSFVKFLFETHGLEKFRRLYSATPLDPSPELFDKLLEDIYAEDLASLEDVWRSHLEAESVPSPTRGQDG